MLLPLAVVMEPKILRQPDELILAGISRPPVDLDIYGRQFLGVYPQNLISPLDLFEDIELTCSRSGDIEDIKVAMRGVLHDPIVEDGQLP